MKTEEEEPKQSEPAGSNKDLDEAVLIENEYNLAKESRDSSTDEVLIPGKIKFFDIILDCQVDKKIKKFHSGNL